MMHVTEVMVGPRETLLARVRDEYLAGDLADLARRIMAAHRGAGVVGERVAGIPDQVWRLTLAGAQPADVEWRLSYADDQRHPDVAHVRLKVVIDRGARLSRSVEITGVAASMWVNTSGSIITSSSR